MKQIIQSLKDGETRLVDVPCPACGQGRFLIQTTRSLVSLGTERMLVSFGKANMIEKARQQPEKVKMVLDKMKTDGVLTTVDAVRSKLAQPLPLGYCNVGVVTKSGDQGSKIGHRLSVGDRVVSNGAHAEMVVVPANLCARIPENVTDEEAAFTVVGSIGLQGIRLARPTLGEAFVVIGVGLIGLLTVQLLRANGCRVLAIDYDAAKLNMAEKFGAKVCHLGAGEDAVAAGMSFSRGNGVDGVLITASTKSSDPVTQAAQMCRKRGRIVLVGVTGLELNRADFYEKEISFQVSCSYGPGRYDKMYEEHGQDYPLGFVRWTEQRNFEAVLDMLACGQLDVKSLISHRVAIEDAEGAYMRLTDDKSALGIVLEYGSSCEKRAGRSVCLKHEVKYMQGKPVFGFIGAGNYASRVLIPAFKQAGAQFHTIVTSGGINGVVHGEKAGFAEASTDVAKILNNPDINTVVIVSRHNSHARFVVDALKAGKHVFVEKPLCLNQSELEEIKSIYSTLHSSHSSLQFMVGFNRRFAPHVQKMKTLLDSVHEPKSFIMTMNAGAIPADHWTQDVSVGGGRITGEACHYIDLMRFLAGSEIVSVQCRCIGRAAGVSVTEDKASITLGFSDGSFGTIHYLANGASAFPKERIEVFAAGRVLQLDNFVMLRGYGWSGFKKMKLWRQDKGQNACAAAFLKAVEAGMHAPISSDELFEVAQVTIDAVDKLRAQV